MALRLVRDSQDCGLIGEETLGTCRGEKVHIGDIVELDGGKHTGRLVIGFEDSAAVMGYGGIPMELMNITTIERRHTEMKRGEVIVSGRQCFKVTETETKGVKRMTTEALFTGIQNMQKEHNRLKNSLGLMRGAFLFGVIGTETTSKCDGETVCIGDKIRVSIEGYQPIEGTVYAQGCGITMTGLVATTLDEEGVTVMKILRSHKELVEGNILKEEEDLDVVKLQGYK